VTLTTQTFEGLPGGMNLALPAQELDDTEARYLQDVLVDKPGLTRRRGPIAPVGGIAALTRKGTAMASALNPQGSARFAVLTGDASNGFLTVYDGTLATTVDLAWPHPLPSSPSSGAPYRIADVKPALRGGAWIGVSSAYDASTPNQALGLWYGGTKANLSVTVGFTRGSQTVTGTGFTAGVDPGMFLFADTSEPYSQAYIGVVKSVESNTSLTLVSAAPYGNGGGSSGTFQSLRGFAPRVAKGHLTTDTGSTTVTGGSTKFRSQKLDTGVIRNGTTTNASAVITGLSQTSDLAKGMPVTGTGIGVNARIQSIDSSSQVTLTVASTASATVSLTFKTPWDLYRASDMTWIGTVLSVQSEVGLTMMANAAIALADEAFVAIRADANFSLVTTGSTFKPGWISANYADRQWYFNNGADFAKTSRGWFSDTSDGEIVDMSDFDGDWIDIVSTSNVNEPIRGAQAAYNGLCVFKENETFLITGSSPSSFGVRKLEDDGVLATGSIQPYAGGVIWAGREGIHLYDGIQAENLTAQKLGDYWKNTIRTFDPTKYRMWSMVDRDHYFLFIESVAPTVAVVKGNVSTTPTKYAIIVNLTTRSITTATNLDIRGSVVLPGSAGRATWFLVNGSTTTAQVGKTTAGASWDAVALNFKQVRQITLSGSAAVSKLSMYLRNQNGSAQVIRPVIYADSAGSPGALVAMGPEYTIPNGTAAGWFDMAFASNIELSSGTYYIGFIAGSTQSAEFAYDTSASTRWYSADTYSDGASDPFGAPTNDSESISVYATTMPLQGIICDGEALFNQEGVDQVTCVGSLAAGPDFYVESKKFDAGDGLRLKRFKQLAVWYLAQGDAMKVDVVLGLNDIGQTLSSNFPVSGFTWDTLRALVSSWDNLKAQFATWNAIVQSVFVPKRVRFQKKNQYMAFRLYQGSSAVTRMQMGPFQLGFKIQRPGRL
jgi:hypothetical protein